MTKDEAQALFRRIMLAADKANREAEFHPDKSRADYCEGTAHGLTAAARMLTEALEKSEARPTTVPTRREVRLPHAEAIARGIDYGSAWASTPRELPEAGPGLWRGVGLWSDGGAMVLTVEQVTP